MKTAVFRTDQSGCYDTAGPALPCAGTGQDGALRHGVAWPKPRFTVLGETVLDRLTGLVWTRNAGLTGFPMMWREALDHMETLNMSQAYGHTDWRLPNRRELFSLVSHSLVNPSLPENHSFINVFSGYYWTSTTCVRLPGQAWYVHLGGGRVFKGMKHGSYMAWPVRGGKSGVVILSRTGQKTCFGESGQIVACAETLQDGALQAGARWPKIRFRVLQGDVVEDRLTGLCWTKTADLTGRSVDWAKALETVGRMNISTAYGYDDWRVPNIRELESITDMGSHSPALAPGHPFDNVKEWYWSCTTSAYDPVYAWALYLVDGNIGVGYKTHADFYVWPVRGGL